MRPCAQALLPSSPVVPQLCHAPGCRPCAPRTLLRLACCAQVLAGAGCPESGAAAQWQQSHAHAAARRVQDEAAHVPAVQEQPAQAGQRQGAALRGPSAAGEQWTSASRWAAFQSCSGKPRGLGSGLLRACAAQPGSLKHADYAHAQLEGLSVRQTSDERAAPLGSTRWGGMTHHTQACADVAFTTAVD